jgi:YidC/Oxa1 family membrane protein insertase
MTTLPIANVFQPLIDVFDHVLVFFHDSVGLSWGMSIIALTVCVRIVLIPLTLKQFRSMQGLQKLAPEIKELQGKYKDDKQRLNQEMMKLYQEHKVNPFGSCLPLVLQLPVFFSLFYMLRKDLKLDICPQVVQYAAQHGTSVASVSCNQVDPGSASFLFINDLTAKATGGTLVILLVLYVGSQLLSGVLMSVTADRNQRFIMIALPFVFVPFIQGFPAGLIVYWITTNFWTVGQQYVIRRSAGLPVRGAPIPAGASAAVAQAEESTKKPKAAVEAKAGKQASHPKTGKQAGQPKTGKQAGQPKAAGRQASQAKQGEPKTGKQAGDGDGDGATAPERERRTTAPPPPPRQRRKKKTGRRR